MSADKPIVGIFTMPQEYPCGPNSSCCGPVGQSAEEVAALRAVIERLGAEVQVHNVRDPETAEKYANVGQLLSTFGAQAIPILTVGDNVVSMGLPTPEKAAKAIEQKLASV